MKKGSKHSIESLIKMSDIKLGKTAWNKGKHSSQKTKERNRLAALGNTNHKGKRNTSESIEKMRISHLGQKPWNKGKTGIYSVETLKKMSSNSVGMLGKKHTIESIEKMSVAKRGISRPDMYGNNNWSWKGGITPLMVQIRNLPKSDLWKKEVIKYDDYTCQNCPQRGGCLEIDHIIPFSFIISKNHIKTVEEAINCSELWDISNGQTLCKACHAKKTQKDMKKHKKVAR